jgi:hypothetical protein
MLEVKVILRSSEWVSKLSALSTVSVNHENNVDVGEKLKYL